MINLQVSGNTKWEDIINYAVHEAREEIDKDEIATSITKEFKANAKSFADKITALRNNDEEFKKLNDRIINLEKETNQFLNEYQIAQNIFQNMIQARLNLPEQADINSIDEMLNGVDKNKVAINQAYINKFDMKKQDMAEKSVSLYIRIINLFQDLELFDPNAVIVVYNKNGLREEFPFNDDVLKGRWKDGSRIKDTQDPKQTIVSIGESCRIIGEGVMKRALKDAKSNNLQTIYDGINSVRNHIKEDFKIFREIVETQAFNVTREMYSVTNPKTGRENHKTRVDKSKNEKLDPNTPIGGLIAEAFEIHYQQYIVQFWKEPPGKENAHKLGAPGDVEHYKRPNYDNGYASIYSMLQLSSGVKQGYYQPDQNWAQSKSDNATFMAISNLSNMLTEVREIYKSLNNGNIEELTKQIVDRFNEPDSVKKFKQFADAFIGEFAEMYQHSNK